MTFTLYSSPHSIFIMKTFITEILLFWYFLGHGALHENNNFFFFLGGGYSLFTNNTDYLNTVGHRKFETIWVTKISRFIKYEGIFLLVSKWYDTLM